MSENVVLLMGSANVKIWGIQSVKWSVSQKTCVMEGIVSVYASEGIGNGNIEYLPQLKVLLRGF